MSKACNLTGKSFGRLVALNKTDRRSGSHVVWLCRCICGNLTEVRSTDLKIGTTRSCGCLRVGRPITHGDTVNGKPTRLYRTWANMNERCYDQKNKRYKRYGGRGISVCTKWRDSYQDFKDWALSNDHRDHLSIDRIDNDGDYTPDNCQWITMSENSKKRGS